MRQAQAGSLASTGRKGLKKAETEQNKTHYFKVSFLKAKTGGFHSQLVYLELSILSISVSWGPGKSPDHSAARVLCICCLLCRGLLGVGVKECRNILSTFTVEDRGALRSPEAHASQRGLNPSLYPGYLLTSILKTERCHTSKRFVILSF